MFNWKKSAEADLKDYKKQKESIKNLTERIKTIDKKIALEKPKKRGDKIMDYLVLKEKLTRNLEISKENIEFIDKGLMGLSDDQQKVLNPFYISGGGFRKVMDEFHIEQAAAYKRKDEALRSFTIAMYGTIES